MRYAFIWITVFLLHASFGSLGKADILVDFSDKALPANSFYNGGPSTNATGWASSTVQFGNNYNSSFGGFWNGFSYSNVNDAATSGFTNQYAAITGTGVGGSGIYAIGFSGSSAFFNLPSGYRAGSIQLTNTTYTYYSMRDGDLFAKKFGGVSGNDADFFRVTFTGYDQLQSDGAASGSTTGSVTFSLADFTFADNSLDYIINSWTPVDLTGLGQAKSIRLSFSSSDVGLFGINTPTYLALDNLIIVSVPEPSSLGLVVLSLGLVLERRRRGGY